MEIHVHVHALVNACIHADVCTSNLIMKSIEILTSFFCANASFCLAVKIENKNKIHDSNFTDFIGSVGLPETAYFEGHRLHI